MHVYNSFYQAQQQLADIEAIDYFFAKEMLTALNVSDDISTQTLTKVTPQLSTKLSITQVQILSHALFALSVSLRAGHTCLPLTEIAEKHWAVAFDEQGQCSHQGFIFPGKDILLNALTILNISADAQQPIVFENNSLYMRRYYQFEQTLAQEFKARLTQRSLTSVENISRVLQQLFPLEENEQPQAIDWQKIAVANAMNKNFTVIAGGPGTGKTYTVTKLLAALVMLNTNNHTNNQANANELSHNPALEIALVAPTGKAAQRLSESIINAITGFKALINDNVLAAIPTEAKTIHRLLGVIPNSPNFRHDQNNLLSCDVLLIDEVSMVDLPMMTRIFRALKTNAKIILLGDADQLPSVAVGSVLADIAPRPHSGYSPGNADYLTQVCQLDMQQLNDAFNQTQNKQTQTYSDHLSFLVTSRRFDGEGGIGRLAAYVIKGEKSQSWQLLQTESKSKASQLALVDGDLTTWLSPLVKKYYQGISKCNNINDAFALLAKFRILCVTRQGEFGVDAINLWVKEQLAVNAAQPWGQSQQNYHGMPIMISENDYRLGLFNGDIGLLWRASGDASTNSSNNVGDNSSSHSSSSHSEHLMAFFEQPKTADGETHYKTLLPSRLPKYDSVYAMTIHKTQGSEFAHIAMLLPKQSNNLLLSRELLYTGITRAKTQLTIASNKQTWQQGVISEVKRYSGLKIID